jgi:polyisoprenoid-binding protein YceI
MRITNRKSAIFAAGLVCGSTIFLSALATPPRSQSTPVAARAVEAQEIVLVLDPAQCKVHYTVDSSLHTVHGTFDLKNGTVHFDRESGKAGGEIVVYATSGESGNNSRDARMHKEILESPKYPDVVFRPTQVEGKVSRDGNSDVKLRGVMLLHGKEHEVVVPVHAQLSTDHWTGTASFPVPYIEWGLKDPSNWLLKVKPVVEIELEMAGSANGQK